MPEYLSPGVYIEEFEIGPRAIEGVSTSTTGFLGRAERGPERVRFVGGYPQFQRIYGEPLQDSYLARAVEGFFANGGKRCFVARIVDRDAAVTAAGNLNDAIRVAAVGPGTWGNRIAIKVARGSNAPPDTDPPTSFNLSVMYWRLLPDPLVDPTDFDELTNPDRREPDLIETYENLSSDPESIDFYENRINPNSNLIRVTRTPDGDGALGELPFTRFSDLDGAIAGADGAEPTVEHYGGEIVTLSQGLPDELTFRTGFRGFSVVEEISIVVAPDHHVVGGLTDEVINHCVLLKNRFAVLHSNPSTDVIAAPNAIRPPQDTSYAAFYFPWIKVLNPRNNQDILIPPSGHIAGIYAKTDIDRGVHKAPANVVVQGARALQFQVTEREQDILNPRGVNCLRVFPARGLRVWGARTSSTNTLWKYINVRRLFIFIEESIKKGTQWVVFEPNDHKLWARVRATITQFLTGVWRSGALFGTTPEEAFFVKCDQTTMTPDDIDNGRLICIIGVAPVKPAEFVIFRITQFSGGADVEELL